MRTTTEDRRILRSVHANVAHPDSLVIALLDDFADLYDYAVSMLVVHENRSTGMARDIVESIQFARDAFVGDVRDGQIIVHILRGGLPLCGFTRDVPCDWPTGHKWIGVEEASLATCSFCTHAMLA